MNKFYAIKSGKYDSRKENKRANELKLLEKAGVISDLQEQVKFELRKDIKPISVNDCWQGKRFKTQEYLDYETELILTLPNKNLPPPPYKIYFEFGFSSVLSDWDNPIKPLQDILQKKYHFDDRDIIMGVVKKIKVQKGKEFFLIRIETFVDDYD